MKRVFEYKMPAPDDRVGGGYSILGKSKGVGTTTSANSEYPYTDTDDFSDLDSDKNWQEIEFTNKFLSKVNQGFSNSGQDTHTNSRDKSTLVKGNVVLKEIEQSQVSTVKISPRRQSGNKDGLSKRPVVDDKIRVNDFRDIPTDDERSMIKSKISIKDALIDDDFPEYSKD